MRLGKGKRMSNEKKIRDAVANVVRDSQNHPVGKYPLRDLIDKITQSVIGTGLVEMDDWMMERPEVTRVELIENSGRAYVKYGVSEVATSLQDEGRTLKLFLRSS
jgi:hypothetical protein